MRVQSGGRGFDEGFTLVELAVVVLIIMILLGVAIATFMATTNAASTAACRHNQAVLNQASDVVRSIVDADPPVELDDLEPYVKNYSGVHTCPTDGTLLEFNATTGAVTCPNHP